MTTIRAYLGGSFDPVHLGHLTMAHQVFNRLSKHFSGHEILTFLLPTAGNPFKGTPTPAQHRLAMLNLATQGTPIQIDSHEIKQTPPIYTIDTVRFLQKSHSDDVLILIMGKDSLLTLPTWKDGQALQQAINFWVFDRNTDDKDVSDHLSARFTTDLNHLICQTGLIYPDPTPIANISSSQLRAWIAHNNPQANLFLPDAVANYINQHALYRQSVI